MELITEELRKKLRNRSKRFAICKFFNPFGGGTWIVSHMDADGDTLWVLADLGMDCCEEGTASLAELQAIKGPGGLGIERDIHFDPKGRTLADFYKLYEERGTLAGVA